MRIDRHRLTATRYEPHLHRMRDVRLPLSRKPRRIAHRNPITLHLNGRPRRLPGLAHLQIVARLAVEDINTLHRVALPRYRILRLLLSPLFIWGRGEQQPAAAKQPAASSQHLSARLSLTPPSSSLPTHTHTGSSGAAPFSTIVALIAMWFCISVPLVFLGAFLGFKQRLADPPVRTNEIPRQIPLQAWYMAPIHDARRRHTAIRCGIHRAILHYVVGMAPALLLRLRLPRLVMLILLVTCAEIAIVCTSIVQRGLPLVVEELPQ